MIKINKPLNRNTTVISIIVIIIVLITLFFFVLQKMNMVDKKAYRSYVQELETAAEDFTSNQDMMDYLKNWAAEENVLFTTDSAQNIIIARNASALTTSKPTVVCVDYNYRTAKTQATAIAAAQSVAEQQIENAGDTIVVFLNNSRGNHQGAAGLDTSSLPADSDIIYLSSESSLHLSSNSYAANRISYSIPCEMQTRTLNTGFKIKIEGLPTDEADASIKTGNNPIQLMNTVLSWLKSKTLSFEIGDLKVGNEGSMYPSSIEFTVLADFSEEEDIINYLDKRIEAFNDNTKDEETKPTYSYEIIEDESQLPSVVLDPEAIDKFNILLYLIKDGKYAFEDFGEAPEGFEPNETCGINSIEQLYYSDGSLVLTMTTSAYNETILNEIESDNRKAANLADVPFRILRSYPSYRAEDTADDLLHRFTALFSKMNSVDAKNIVIKEEEDKGFNAMSILHAKQPEAAIIHLALPEGDSSTSIRATNTIMNIIASSDRSGILNQF